MRKTLIIWSCVAALMTTACTGESSRPEATGEGQIRAIHAIPTGPNYQFLIEERSIGLVDYGRSSDQIQFDDLVYLFHFEATLGGDLMRSRLATVEIDLQKDVLHTLVATGDAAAPTIITWEKPVREWDGTETVFEAQFAHTAESLGPIDVYFAAPGVAPAAGAAIGSVAFGEILPVAEYPDGEYVYTITSAGNPGDILFESNTYFPTLASGIIISVFDSTANEPGDYIARLFNDLGGSGSLGSVAAIPSVRFIHANETVGDVDIYTDIEITDQILAGHSFRDITDDIDLETGFYEFNYTAAGNVGAILATEAYLVLTNTRNQIYLYGNDSVARLLLRNPDRRSVETEVKLQFLHTAVNHPFVDFYMVEAGTDIEDVLPRFIRLIPGNSTPVLNPAPGDLELYLTVADEKTIVAGPIPLTAELGDVFEYISYDNVDPTIADVVLVPLP